MINENGIRSIVREELENFLIQSRIMYCEGIDIDAAHKLVSFNPHHQDNVDTNDLINPYVITNDVRDERVISLFQRKDNLIGNDGNPLIYALKGINGWSFANPKYDVFALIKRFVSVINGFHWDYDTLIMTPSNNSLNTTFYNAVNRMVNFNASFTTFFKKLSSETVRNMYVDWDKVKKYCEFLNKSQSTVVSALNKAFDVMRDKNDGIFSYKMLPNLQYREFINQSMEISFANHSLGDYADAINGKNILILDDTVASGKTISDSANAIREMFDAESITFLTLFSPKSSQGFENKKHVLL